ncbi:MarR family transcriptional regulator [Marinomonas spartinae]|uniref:MarR family transcriptional regulator n=1 Tax=Marinomonas spartinae TaxID=1792290 RepID=UPI0018F144EF|nr:MarR family transcriptional regulator [Marinomonas spartinae]MBJ7555417.1 hypothetical protein [Marinomonas spartinae]
MSYQLTTLDHKVMGVLLEARGGVALQVLVRRSKTTKSRALKSIDKLMALGFICRCVEDGTSPLFSVVLGCSYFPPVSDVATREGLDWDDEELNSLVETLEPVLTGTGQQGS